MTPRQFLKILKDDENWLKYNSILTRAKEHSTFTALTREIETLHASRPSRKLYLNAITPDRLIDANLEDIAYRSRCTEIITTVVKENRLLLAALDATYNYILTSYTEELSDIKTKGERESVVKSLLQEGYEKAKEMDKLVEIAKYVVEDIDKTSWAFKNLVELIKITTHRENIISQVEI